MPVTENARFSDPVPLLREDFPACADLYRRAFAGSPWNEQWTQDESLAILDFFAAHPGYQGYKIVTAAGEPAGFLMARYIFPFLDFRIDELVIAPAFQGQGLGTRLMAHAEAVAAALGAEKVSLRTQAQSPAEEFYRGLGYDASAKGVHMDKRIA